MLTRTDFVEIIIMAIEWQWDNTEKTRVLVEFTSDWTWDDFHRVQADLNRNLDERKPGERVDIIEDFRLSPNLPPKALVNMRHLAANTHDHAGVFVLVGMSPVVKAVWNAFTRLYATLAGKKKFLFAATPDEARTILDDIRKQAK